jgi:hypothetical protein
MRARVIDRKILLIGILHEVKRRWQSLELTQIALASKAGGRPLRDRANGAGNLQPYGVGAGIDCQVVEHFDG